MDKLLENIEDSFKEINSSSFNYKLEARFPYDGEFVDITGMFSTPKELKEVSITPKNRRIIAKNVDGFEELIDLGFKAKEIIKAY